MNNKFICPAVYWSQTEDEISLKVDLILDEMVNIIFLALKTKIAILI